MMFSDIYQYNIPEVARLTASDEDINRANDMKKKPWMQNKQWQKELNLFLHKKEKCELDAFFKHGFKYLSETYLPPKASYGRFNLSGLVNFKVFFYN